MTPLIDLFDAWKLGNPTTIDIVGLRKRNGEAHKWKAPFRCWYLHALVAWRLEDILRQSYLLYKMNHLLGARILLRSGIETLAILINLNQRMENVVLGKVEFPKFCNDTEKLILGSKNKSTNFEALNIVTIIEKCGVRYPPIKKFYGELSETSHPNCEGMQIGYSGSGKLEHSVEFSNYMSEMFSQTHEEMLMACIEIFVHEYDDVWPQRFEALEVWLEKNCTSLSPESQNRKP